ncbi:glycosyltransferase family 4 protein [Haloferula helveola]|uniref:glycosyltransferase family 4 protein n=1 Tax=Haloferula helveola TaxID=490095 RepID=UPI0030D1014A
MEKTRRLPILGGIAYLTACYGNKLAAERLRFRMYPFFDKWMSSHLRDGDSIYSSYGYANTSFRRTKELGGNTFVDGGNSHPRLLWGVLSEENERWGVAEDPISQFHYERSLAMMEDTDFVVSPSSFVTRSFLDNGFTSEQILPSFYPVNLSLFHPAEDVRPANRPFTLINTSGLSFRKGTPYLLEMFRRIHRQIPRARFQVTRSDDLHPEIERLLKEYSELPIEWMNYMRHEEMAQRFRQADLLVLPSLEDGFARVVTEAMSCGLPVIVSENTGACDLVTPGVTGSVHPIRDVESMVDSALGWWERIREGYRPAVVDLQSRLSPDAYAKRILDMIKGLESLHRVESVKEVIAP